MEQISQARSTGSIADTAGTLYRVVKRIVDVTGAAVLLVVLSPVMLVIGVATVADSGIPIIYRSTRLGRYGVPIVVLKFRTMRDGSHHHLAELLTADEERQLEYLVNRKLRDDPRRTRVGAFYATPRSTSFRSCGTCYAAR